MDDHKIDVFESVVLTFTIYILFSIIWQTFGDVDAETLKLLTFFDIISCAIFIYDWIRRYKFAEKKKKFVLYNSLDLIASMPFLYVFNYVGYLKALRLISLIRLFGGINRIVYYLRNNEIQTFKLLFSVFFIFVIIASPILILYFESHAGGNIKTAEQALWWTYCTLTTIGYGDFFPSSSIGRFLAVLVSIAGISLFGIFVNNLGEYFKNHGKN